MKASASHAHPTAQPPSSPPSPFLVSSAHKRRLVEEATASPDSAGTHPGLLSAWRPEVGGAAAGAGRLAGLASPGESEEEEDGRVGDASPTPAKARFGGPPPPEDCILVGGVGDSLLFGGGDGPVEVDASVWN